METVWDVLLTKSEVAAKKQRLNVQDLKRKKDRADAQNRKLRDLIAEYHGRLSEIQSRSHSLAEAGSYRQFIVQIQELFMRSEKECHSLEKILAAAKKDLILSENEKLKFESLVQREKNTNVQKQIAKETRNLEENVTLQYNWK